MLDFPSTIGQPALRSLLKKAANSFDQQEILLSVRGRRERIVPTPVDGFLGYRTITGRRLKLEGLSADERKLLVAIEKKFRARPEWTEFASWWVSHFRKARLPASSVVRRVCQDLEARLGIAQRKVAAPDYRDYLADLIEERFGLHYKFCEAAGIDPGQLSRVFASRADLSLPALQKILHVHRNNYDVAVVFSQDQDLSEQRRWIKMACAFPFRPGAPNCRGINNTDWICMDRAMYDACVDPFDYRGSSASGSRP